jgi:type I restriction enzyme S subunit
MTAKMSSLKNPVRASWIRELGCRLDAPPFVSGALEARKTIEVLNAPKNLLSDVVQSDNNGVFHAGRITRLWVSDKTSGTPFLSGTDIFQDDFSNLSLISNKVVKSNPKLLIKPSWILITRSGTVGRTVFSRSDMADCALTEDVLRVVPDPYLIPPGYLFAFLASRFGVPVVASGTYGSIIQHLEPEHILPIEVPRFGRQLEARVDGLVNSAACMRVDASESIRKTCIRLEEELGLWSNELDDISRRNIGYSVDSRQLEKSRRMEATYYRPVHQAIDVMLDKLNTKFIADVCDVVKPGMFKRIYAHGPANGLAFLTGSDLFQSSISPKYWVSRRTPNIDACILEPNWVLIQAFGQIGGLIGRCILTTESLRGSAATDLQIQLRCKTRETAGFLYAYLNTRPGYLQTVRLPIGGSIPHLYPKHIETMRIPWPSNMMRDEVGAQIAKAWEDRAKATEQERHAISIVEQAIEENA